MFVFVCVCASTVRLNVFIFLMEKVKYMITCWMLRPIKINKIISHHFVYFMVRNEKLYSNDYICTDSAESTIYH